MRKFTRRSVAVYAAILVCTALPASAALAAEPDDVAEVVHLIRDKKTKKRLESQAFYYDGGVEVAFVFEGRRYTVYHSGNKEKPFLSITSRPKNSRDDKELKVFTDRNLDGRVDYGVYCRRYSSKKELFDAETNEGEEFRPQWQQRYDQAINDALDRLK